MLCSVLTAVSIFAGACSDATPQVLAGSPPIFKVETAREMINAHRAKYGLPPVTVDQRLMQAAKAHSADIARRGRLSHRGIDGTYPKDRARAAGYDPRLASENLGAGYHSTGDVIRGWQQSRGHNENLLRRGAKHMGMALVYRPGQGKETFWTLLMGQPR